MGNEYIDRINLAIDIVKTLTSKKQDALNNKDKMQGLRHNARKTILDKYALKDLLPKHVEYVKQLKLNNKVVLK